MLPAGNHEVLRKVGLTMCLLAIGLAIAVLLGWVYNIQVLKSIVPGAITFKANTAITMLLSGIAMALLYRERIENTSKICIMILSLAVIALSALSLCEDFFFLDLGIDQFIFKDVIDAENPIPGHMPASSAYCYILLGIAILIGSQPVFEKIRLPILATVSTTVLMICGLAFIGKTFAFMYKVQFWGSAGMAVHAAAGTMLLATAMLVITLKDYKLTWSMDKLITGVFALGIVLLLGAASESYRFTILLQDNIKLVAYTQNVLVEIGEIIEDSAVLQNGQRGYLITGDAKLLASREKIKQKTQQDIVDLDELIPSDSDGQKSVEKIRKLMTERMAWEEQTILAVKLHSLSYAQHMIASGKGIQLADEMNTVLTTMEQEQYTLLAKYQQQANDTSTRTFLLLPLQVFFSMTILILGLFLLNSNIIARRKNEAARIQLDAIVQSSADAIIGKDLNSIVTSWNAAAEKMFGYSAHDMLGQSIMLLIPPDRYAEESVIINKIKHGETIEHFETERIRKDGTLMNVSVTASPIRDNDNNIIGVSKIARDITNQKQLEKQLQQSQKMEAIGQLTGGIAHDFNNLLGIIIGNLDLIEEQIASNKEVLENVHDAQKAAIRGADLTKRLLAFSRLQQLNPTPTSLENSINNIMAMAARTLGPEIRIITKLDNSVPPVFVDPAGLESALLNLAVNARDAMPHGGSITISTQLVDLDEHFLLTRDKDLKPGRYAHIMLSDTGHGMSAEVLAKVFEPFFTTKPRGKGTGLGLSMVYGFVKQSGGLIRIYSEINHGTTISMFLPLTEESALPIKEVAIDKNKFTANANGTVLVVDDEIALLKIAVTFLEKIGYKVLRAADGPSALVILEREKNIDLLLTDIIMSGGINGVELAAKARQIKPNIKVVYSSGFPSEALAERSGAKIDGPLLNKPYNRKIFVETILNVMEQQINND